MKASREKFHRIPGSRKEIAVLASLSHRFVTADDVTGSYTIAGFIHRHRQTADIAHIAVAHPGL